MTSHVTQDYVWCTHNYDSTICIVWDGEDACENRICSQTAIATVDKSDASNKTKDT
jgi:hypothetical protein